MSVYRPKGKDGRLSKFWNHDFTIDGVRFRGSTKATTRRAAERIEARERDKVLLGDTGKETIMLSEAFERYYQEHAQYQPSASDTDAQLDRLLAGLGDHTLDAFNDGDISEYVARRRGQKARHSDRLVSPATVNRETELLRRVWRRAKKNWSKAVADIDWSLHLLAEPEERVRELKATEETNFLNHVRPDMVPLIRFCTITGTRLMSALRLTWKDIDYDARQITLRDKGNSRTKGDRTRLVPITGELLALLATEKGKHPIHVFVYQCRRSRGQRRKGEFYPYSKNGWRKDWQAALAAAGLEDFRFHDTRHTAGSRITRKAGIAVAQKLLGHTEIATTRRYSHVNMEDVKAAMEAVWRQESATPAPAELPNSLNKRDKAG